VRVPIAWLREYVDLPSDAQAIADRFAMLGFPVDAIELRPDISGVVAGKIVAIEKHPNADRLLIGTIDVGGDRHLTIATAATNVAVGQVIPVATIGAKLPHVTIERRKMRGVESEGMMCSPDELALPPEWFEEDGIMQLDADTPLGTDVVAHFHLSDAVLDVDITTNRPDALSMIGLARELGAVLGTPVRLPSFENPATQADSASLRVSIESPDCTRFVAQRFTDVRVGPAPAWMRIRLALAGQRPINNLVDAANYAMLEVGQPLHFYDDAKIAGHHLVVRDARPGEKLVTLDDAEYELTPQSLVIADERAALGLAGLKGGKSSEVSAATTAIVLESANFTGARVRRMSARLGLRTDASSRHEKMLAPALTDMGAARAAQLLVSMGATAYAPLEFGAAVVSAQAIRFPIHDVERLLGFALGAEAIRAHLEALGCVVAPDGTDTLRVTSPPWRRDLLISADLIEEVARMVGYDKIEDVMPPVYPQEISSRPFRLERKLAHALARLGYNEIITHSLHGAALFEKIGRAGITPSPNSVEVRNPLSEDQRFLRYAIGPGTIEYFARIARPARVFEVGHVFGMNEGAIEETTVLTFGFSLEPKNEPSWHDTDFLRIKGDAIELVRTITGRFPDTARDTRNGLHPGKTAALLLDGREVATVGRIDPRLNKPFDLALTAYVGHVYVDALPDYVTPQYIPPSRFPSTYRDLALAVALDVTADDISKVAARASGALCTGVRVFDEYRGPQVGEGRKSLAVRITMQRTDGTITDEEADEAIARALPALHAELGAEIRS